MARLVLRWVLVSAFLPIFASPEQLLFLLPQNCGSEIIPNGNLEIKLHYRPSPESSSRLSQLGVKACLQLSSSGTYEAEHCIHTRDGYFTFHLVHLAPGRRYDIDASIFETAAVPLVTTNCQISVGSVTLSDQRIVSLKHALLIASELMLSDSLNEASIILSRVTTVVPKYPEALDLKFQIDVRRRSSTYAPDTIEADLRYRLCSEFIANGLLLRAEQCLRDGHEQWPMQSLWANELGNLQLHLGKWGAACTAYGHAYRLGLPQAITNVALCFEIEGDPHAARKLLEDATSNFISRGESVGALFLRLATLLPRIMPSTTTELRAIRESKINALAQLTGTSPAGPFSELFARHCEPLEILCDPSAGACASSVSSTFGTTAFCNASHRNDTIPLLLRLPFAKDLDERVLDLSLSLGFYFAFHGETGNVRLKRLLATAYRRFAGDELGTVASSLVLPRYSTDKSAGSIRVGFVSRFLYRHSIGSLMSGVIETLAADNEMHVIIFGVLADANNQNDDLILRLRSVVDSYVDLPHDLKRASLIISRHDPEILVYPEIGMDSLTYLLAHHRLAAHQIAWWGHPDTSGIPTVDYFITANAEESEASMEYSEQLVRFGSLGTRFEFPELADKPRTLIYFAVKS